MIIRKEKDLKLKEIKGDKYNTYRVVAYIGQNRKREPILCYSKTRTLAYQAFDKLVAKIPSDFPVESRAEFLEKHVKRKTKHDNPYYQHFENMEFGKSRLGGKLRAALKEIESSPVSSSHKVAAKAMVKSILLKTTNEKTITKNITEKLFAEFMDPDKKLSPTTVNSYRKTFVKISKMVNAEPDKLLKGITFYNKDQLDKLGVEYNELNRRHLEKSEIKKLIPKLLEIEDTMIRSGCFIQLWCGARPSDGIDFETSERSLIINATKTKTAIQMDIDTALRAYMFVCSIEESEEKVNRYSKQPNLQFKKALKKAKLDTTLDRYCLRHTALTQRCVDGTPYKLVAQMAGHCNLRMLDEHYVNKIIKEDSPFDEVMELDLPDLRANYHTWLLESCIIARWPELMKNKTPKDPDWKVLGKILKPKKEKKKKKTLKF